MPEGNIIGVISIKGGVGKTTTVANIGASLANDFHQKVLLVDANFSAPNLGMHLGMVHADNTLHDVLSNKIDVPKAIYSHEYGFDILPASVLHRDVNPFQLKRKISYLKNHYDTILIDSSPTLNNELLATMLASDQLLVVTNPDYPTLMCTLHAVKVAKEKNTPITGLILNKVHDKPFELDIHEIEEASKTPVLAVLPDDIKVHEAVADAKPVVLNAPYSEVAMEYKKLAGALIGQEYKDTRVWHNVKRLFSRDKPKHEVNRVLHSEKVK